MTDRCFLMESCPSWSKEHDWKSCNESTLIRGFESLALRHNIFVDKPLIIKGLSAFLQYFTYAIRLLDYVDGSHTIFWSFYRNRMGQIASKVMILSLLEHTFMVEILDQ